MLYLIAETRKKKKKEEKDTVGREERRSERKNEKERETVSPVFGLGCLVNERSRWQTLILGPPWGMHAALPLAGFQRGLLSTVNRSIDDIFRPAASVRKWNAVRLCAAADTRIG